MTQVLNFGAFKTQNSANERTSTSGFKRGQNFIAKYRKFVSKKGGNVKTESIFTVSDKKFDEMELANYGLIQLLNPEGVTGTFIAVVENDKAIMMKRTDKLKGDAEKGRKFKSTKLEAALLAEGVIEDKESDTQYLDFVKVGENVEVAGIQAIAIYQIVASEKLETGEDDVESNDDDADIEDSDMAQSNDPSLSEGTINGGASTDDF